METDPNEIPDSSLLTSAIEEGMGSFLSLRGVLIFAGATVLALTLIFLVAGVTRGRAGVKPLSIEKIPISEEVLASWIEATSELRRLREESGTPLAMDNLPAFISWGKTDPEFLATNLGAMDPARFLGVTLTIAGARKHLGALEEYDQRVKDLEKRKALMDESFAEIAMPQPPAISGPEETDFLVYQAWLESVEGALAELLPSLSPLSPSQASMNPAGETQPSKPIQWRVVNRSRYGPRVIREK
jgi:hypothetical protein